MLFAVSCAKSEGTNSTDNSIINIEQPNVTIENIYSGVSLTWDEVPNAEGYYVFSKTEGGQYELIATITESETTNYLDADACVGTDYCYAVRAYVSEQMSDYEELTITTGIWQPEITVTYTESVMNISWQQITGSDGYIVYRRVINEDYEILSVIEDFENASYVDNEVEVGQVYEYAVRAYKEEIRSSYNSVICAAIRQPIVELENIGDGVKVSWLEIEEADGYFIYRKEEGGQYQIIRKIEGRENTVYLDSDLILGKKYYYAVRAYLGEYQSSYVATDIFVDLGRVLVSLENKNSGVQLEWNRIDSAEGYYVYKKEEGETDYTLVNTITDNSIISYLDLKVEKGVTYYYAVRAYLGDSVSNYSGGTISIANY